MLFHCNNGCTNAPQCYVIRSLSVLALFRKVCIVEHTGCSRWSGRGEYFW